MLPELHACPFCQKNEFQEPIAVNSRRHQKVCLRNPNRTTWTCDACDLTFPHYSGLSSHKKSKAHLEKTADAAATTTDGGANAETTTGAKDEKSLDASAYPDLAGVPRSAFSVLLVDPPFSYKKAKGRGAAANHYETTSDEYLASLPVGALAKRDALLFVWCSGATLDHAIALCSAWGFTYKTVAFVWAKTNRSGTPQSIALGSYTRPGAEFVLLATRGKATSLVGERVDQVFLSRRTTHSTKPEHVAQMIDRMVDDAKTANEKIELFARGRPRDGWFAWGDQVETS